MKVVGGLDCFQIDPLRRAFQAWHSVLDLELISPDCLEPMMCPAEQISWILFITQYAQLHSCPH